ncbi:MAG: cellulose synthase operon protein YhjQ/BcsQ [Pseudomonadota bacterium]
MMPAARSDIPLYALLSDARRVQLSAAGIQPQSLKPVVTSPATEDLPVGMIVIDFQAPGAEALLEAYALRRPDCAMLLIGRDLPTESVRTLFRFAASDLLNLDAGPADVIAACERLSQALQTSNQSNDAGKGARCWALRGAVGGAGVTTLATELAFAALRVRPSWRVCVVDLNLTDGMSASYLDAEKKLDVSILGSAPERIDASLLNAYAFEHAKGIFLLAAPRNPNAEQMAKPEGVLRLLDVACTMFDHVIVDVPRHRAPWTDTVLAAVDEVVVVSELTVPSLHAAGELCRETDVLRQGAPSRLLLNRMFAKRTHRHSFPLDKAERAIHRKVDHTVRSDWEHARMAVNLGMPVAQVKPKSALVKDVEDIAQTLLAVDEAQEARAA